MKKMVLLGIIILLVLSIFTGCQNDPKLESMTFVDNIANPSKEFTINENLGFTVSFFDKLDFMSAINPGFDIDELDEDELEEFNKMGIIKISGFVRDTNNTWKNTFIMGTARDMYANNAGITELVDFIEVDIVMNYEYDNGEISEVNIEFTNADDPLVLSMAMDLMGGTYLRK